MEITFVGKTLIIIVVIFWLCWKMVWLAGYLICWAYTRLFLYIQKNKKGTVTDCGGKEYDHEFNENRIHFILKHYIKRWIDGYYRYKIIKTGQIASHLIRKFVYSYVFKISFSENAILYYGAEIRHPYNLKLGRGTIIGDRSVLDARCGITIGKHVNLSSEVHIWTLQHNYNCPHFSAKNQCRPVVIKDRAWIGPRVTILPGVTVGEGAVIGAGAVVTKDVNPYTVNGGIPSKQIGPRNSDLSYCFSGKYIPFL